MVEPMLQLRLQRFIIRTDEWSIFIQRAVLRERPPRLHIPRARQRLVNLIRIVEIVRA